MEALENDKIYGAAVDVTDPEPLPADHPMWKTKNLLITPHISGNYHLKETLNRIIQIAGRNLEAMRNHTQIENEVNFETGYRK